MAHHFKSEKQVGKNKKVAIIGFIMCAHPFKIGDYTEPVIFNNVNK